MIWEEIRGREVTSVLWWGVTSGPITGPTFISPSQRPLCPCPIDPPWHCHRAGSRCGLSPGNPAVPNGGTSPRFRAPHGGSTTHVSWPAATSTRTATEAESERVRHRVCVHADEVCDLVCSCGEAWGPRIGELLCYYLKQKLTHFFPFKDTI